MARSALFVPVLIRYDAPVSVVRFALVALNVRTKVLCDLVHPSTQVLVVILTIDGSLEPRKPRATLVGDQSR